jgi:arylsulfatase A-like enzyme
LFQSLESSGVLDDTILVLTSDHGEQFERGVKGHLQRTLHQPIMKIPLFIFDPDQNERVDIYENTSSIDLLPTMLELSKKPIPDWIEGQVLPFYNSSYRNVPIFANVARGTIGKEPIKQGTFSVIKDGIKLIYYFGYEDLPDGMPQYELYKLEEDPEELVNLYESESKIAQSLLELIQQKIADADGILS